MSTTPEDGETPTKTSKLPLIIGLVLAILGGTGGFYATYSGIVSSILGQTEHAEEHGASHDESHDSDEHETEVAHQDDLVEFVPLEPITINFGSSETARHLRFSAQLEVEPSKSDEVRRLEPRIIDVLNIYLRALAPHELEEPAALMRLRGQMLRRVQIVTGPQMVRNLLVMEFIFI